MLPLLEVAVVGSNTRAEEEDEEGDDEEDDEDEEEGAVAAAIATMGSPPRFLMYSANSAFCRRNC